jgi:cellulose synthase/poly-beta-1,6-N-acetylglucosamine synthase-like glycosyltransferase
MPIKIGNRMLGLGTWALVTLPIWGALLAPLVLAWAILLFNTYWFVRSASLAVGAAVGYLRLRRSVKMDWRARAGALPGFERVHHLILIPTYQESDDVLRATLDHLVNQDFPTERISVVLAFEGRDKQAPARAARMLAMYRARFGGLWALFHPALPGDVPGKSSNLAWAGPRARKLLERRGISGGDVLVTVCDADSRLHPKYLSALSESHLVDPNRENHLYQPAILFHANMDRLLPWLRISNCAYSAWSLARLSLGSRLVLQSTYSLPLDLCIAVGYWDADVIPEDSRICFKVMLNRGKMARVKPIFLPVLADAAEGTTVWETVVAQYRQIRRWAWGASDVTYVLSGLARTITVDGRRPRLAPVLGFIEDHISWPSHWFLITLGLHLPPLLAPPFAHSPQGIAILNLASAVITASLPCLLVAIVVDRLLRGMPVNPLEWLYEFFGWLMLPILGLAFVTLPALDAHTRLLFGRPLSYQATPKLAR